MPSGKPKQLLQTGARLSRELLRMDGVLASVPAEESILELVKERHRLESAVAAIASEAGLLDEELEKKKRLRDQLKCKIG